MCKYGKRCYQKNAKHMQTYSHDFSTVSVSGSPAPKVVCTCTISSTSVNVGCECVCVSCVVVSFHQVGYSVRVCCFCLVVGRVWQMSSRECRSIWPSRSVTREDWVATSLRILGVCRSVCVLAIDGHIHVDLSILCLHSLLGCFSSFGFLHFVA